MNVAYGEFASKPNRIRPLLALRFLRTMIRYASSDSNATYLAGAGFYHATEGRSGQQAFDRLQRSKTGKQLLSERPELREYLADRTALMALCPGSLGRNYAQFMKGDVTIDVLDALQASGVVRTKTASEAWFNQRQEDLHDLRHLVTGYGVDDFGELCLLAFRFAQSRHPGSAILTGLFAFSVKWRMRDKPVFAAVREAYRRGQDSVWQDDLPWEEMLSEPLTAVQARLRLTSPVIYGRICSAPIRGKQDTSARAGAS